MKNFRYISLFSACALLVAGCTADLDNTSVDFDSEALRSAKILNTSANSCEGSIIVRFKSDAERTLASRAILGGATRSGVLGVDAILDKVGGYSVEPVFIINDQTREKVMEMGLHLWYVLHFEKETDLDLVAEQLAEVAEVERVQFNEKIARNYKPRESYVGTKVTSIQEAIATRNNTNEDIPFSDGYKQYLWGLHNKAGKSYVEAPTGTTFNAVAEADVNALPAWKLCTGDPSIVVAVVDEGVMYSHEDLEANFLINIAEKYGSANLDDDGNGYVDDIYGFNFAGSTPTNKISWTGANDSGHGTHVAGIVAAVNNNRIGISSIAGGNGTNNGVKVFSVQIFDNDKVANSSNTAKAMQYAAIRGAHIMQCSWGYPSGAILNDGSFARYSRVEMEGIDYFIKNGGSANGPMEGGLAIFAAGNEMGAIPGYPAAYKNCIAVTSIGPALKPAYYTNYGKGSDIGAPGGDLLYGYGGILSTVPSQHSALTDSGTGQRIPYDFFQGTSMACPMVSGVAALGLSYAKQLGKRYTADEFRSMLLTSSNNFDPFFTGSQSFTDEKGRHTLNFPSYIGQMGTGYIDAYKMLLQVEGTPFFNIATNRTSTINLAPIFGEGVAALTLSSVEVSDEDKAAVGLTTCKYNNGSLELYCTKEGCITITVSLLVGGDNANETAYPAPTVATKRFVVIVRENAAYNGGWL